MKINFEFTDTEKELLDLFAKKGNLSARDNFSGWRNSPEFKALRENELIYYNCESEGDWIRYKLTELGEKAVKQIKDESKETFDPAKILEAKTILDKFVKMRGELSFGNYSCVGIPYENALLAIASVLEKMDGNIASLQHHNKLACEEIERLKEEYEWFKTYENSLVSIIANAVDEIEQKAGEIMKLKSAYRTLAEINDNLESELKRKDEALKNLGS
jgi:predicted RNase H-like nuclease (RuvC/YqgF family)